MEAGQTVTERIDQLIALFNRGSLDLPDGLFDRRSQFLLNGVPFEEMLGRPPGDPLVLMLARGPAGYRFIVKAVQHAVPDARVQRGALERSGAGADSAASQIECWLSGHLRGVGDPAEMVFGIALHMHAGGSIERADVTMDEAAVARLRDARLRP